MNRETFNILLTTYGLHAVILYSYIKNQVNKNSEKLESLQVRRSEVAIQTKLTPDEVIIAEQDLKWFKILEIKEVDLDFVEYKIDLKRENELKGINCK